MVNKRGGKKHKRGKKTQSDTFNIKNLIYAEKDQEYAVVLSRVGGSRLKVECTDGKIRSAIIRGKFKRRIWMNQYDIILVSIGATGKDDECYIEYKYNDREIGILKQKNLIEFDTNKDDCNDNVFEFENDNENETVLETNKERNLNFDSMTDSLSKSNSDHEIASLSSELSQDSSDSINIHDL